MPRVSQAHRDARRRQILDAARTRFAQDGFHRTSMDDVIRAAGLSAGAVYGYFPGKTALVHAVVDDALDEVLRAFEAAHDATLAGAATTLDAPAGDALPGPAFVGAVVDGALREFSRSGVDASRIALFAWAETLVDDALRARVAERLGELRARLRAVVTASPALPGTAPVPDDLGDDASLALLAAPVGAIVQRHVFGAVDGEGLARGLTALARAWSPGPDGALRDGTPSGEER
jgi:AcrR family transcriptional regulator